MLMMTRTDNLLEVGDGGRHQLKLDTSRIANASLCTERAPTGTVRQVLVLCLSDGSPCVRIESGPRELTALHQAITEMMLDQGTSSGIH